MRSLALLSLNVFGLHDHVDCPLIRTVVSTCKENLFTCHTMIYNYRSANIMSMPSHNVNAQSLCQRTSFYQIYFLPIPISHSSVTRVTCLLIFFLLKYVFPIFSRKIILFTIHLPGRPSKTKTKKLPRLY